MANRLQLNCRCLGCLLLQNSCWEQGVGWHNNICETGFMPLVQLQSLRNKLHECSPGHLHRFLLCILSWLPKSLKWEVSEATHFLEESLHFRIELTTFSHALLTWFLENTCISITHGVAVSKYKNTPSRFQWWHLWSQKSRCHRKDVSQNPRQSIT